MIRDLSSISGSECCPAITLAAYRDWSSAMPGMDPKIGRTNPTNASEGSTHSNRYLYHWRGSASGAVAQSRNGKAIVYPEQVMMISALIEVPSLKVTT